MIVLSSEIMAAVVELVGLTAVLYLLMSYPTSLLARGLERRLGLEQRA